MNVAIGKTIWEQIPTSTKRDLNARDLVGTETGLFFVYGFTTAKLLHKIEVRLDASDTYTVRTWEINRRSWDTRVVREMEGIYADGLGQAIEIATGKQR